MAHIRRGRMNISDAVAVNTSKAKSVTLGFQAKKATTKATLKSGNSLHLETLFNDLNSFKFDSKEA